MQGGQEELLIAAAPALVGEALARFGAIRLRARGTSMWPAIRPGDVLVVHRCTAEELTRGDVALALRGTRLFAHRVAAVETGNAGVRLITRGDTHWHPDPAVHAADLLGRVVAVERRAGRAFPVERTSHRPLALAAGLAVSAKRLALQLFAAW